MLTTAAQLVTKVDHPAALMALGRLRNERTAPAEFRRQSEILATALILQATQRMEVDIDSVQTPLARTISHVHGTKVVVVPVLRAGLALAEVFCRIIPEATTHHIGIARDERTALPERYYPKEVRPIDPRAYVVLADPMLATGGSAIDALDQIMAAGAKDIRIACVVAAQAGIDAVRARYPDVAIYTVAIDPELNEKKYIVPGLGDFGDRFFGTI